MKICGVDPGLHGALVLLEAFEDKPVRFVECCDMPIGLRSATSEKEQVSALAIKELWLRWQPETIALELVNAMAPPGSERRMGAASAFNFGHSFCVPETMAYALGIPLVLVTPGSWKATMGLRKSDKRASLMVAQRMWPVSSLSLMKHEARAEAALIAMHVLYKQGRLNDVEFSGPRAGDGVPTAQALPWGRDEKGPDAKDPVRKREARNG